MKIAIDISQVVYGTGVSVYTKELVNHLSVIDNEDQFLLFGGSIRRTNDLRRYTEKILPISPTLADFIWNRFHILNIEKFIGKIDVLHSSDWTQPPTNAFRVTTVHDLAPIKYPQDTPKKIVEVHTRRLYWVLREVDRVIVPTESVKKDLIEIGAKEERIRVVHEGVGADFKKTKEEEILNTKRKFNIHEDYILSVGVGARKNTKRIIEAFQKSSARKLVIVGGDKKNLDTRNVIFTGFISDTDLINLYSGASALVYPSLYEGFGLPILQAFATGCPVLTSDNGAMREICGDAGILVNPLDVNSIAAGIEKVITNPKTLSKKGFKRVKDFSWDKCARQTLEVYKESKNNL